MRAVSPQYDAFKNRVTGRTEFRPKRMSSPRLTARIIHFCNSCYWALEDLNPDIHAVPLTAYFAFGKLCSSGPTLLE